ncbi:unnamed protein product, partial [Meganyctiphanes norvegica]
MDAWVRKLTLLLLAMPTILLLLSYNSRSEMYYENNRKLLTNEIAKRKQQMVSVSHPDCRKLFQIGGYYQKEFPGEDVDMESVYRNLSELVPPTAVDQGMMTPTRLQAVNGSLPYLPCRVQLYGAKQLRHCLLRRSSITKNDINYDDGHKRSDLKSRNVIPTWLAFVGDSKMKDKFVAIVFGLRAEFNWSTSLDPQTNGLYVPVSMEYLENALATEVMLSMRAVSHDGLLQVDFVWSSRGIVTDSGKNNPVQLLNRWTTTSEDIPHLIVMGMGYWTFMRALQLRQNFLAPYDAILKNWMQAKDVLVSLAARTNVLVWPQGRKRECVAFDHIRSKHFEISDILYH